MLYSVIADTADMFYLSTKWSSESEYPRKFVDCNLCTTY